MKTLKITEQTHKQILSLQNYLYQKENTKYTIDKLIKIAITELHVKVGEKYGK